MTWQLTLGLFALFVGSFILCWAYGSVVPQPSPSGGRRGLARGRALATHTWLRMTDRTLRKLAALVGPLMPAQARERLDRWLYASGRPLGLGAVEFVVLSFGSAALGAVAGSTYGATLGTDATGAALTMGVLGACFPLLRVRATADARQRAISHSLPATIDLCALCMNAGLDFRTSLENVVVQAPDPKAPLTEELRHLLRALDLGSTRAQALRDLARSAPIPSVQDLVNAVVQGEQKGTALSEVLAVQAELLRRQRSIAAEEAAARAAVLLVLPLLLLMGCMLIIMFAKFLVEGFGL